MSTCYSWTVQSHSDPGIYYRVNRAPAEYLADWDCSCPHFGWRGIPCKHIEQVKKLFLLGLYGTWASPFPVVAPGEPGGGGDSLLARQLVAAANPELIDILRKMGEQ